MSSEKIFVQIASYRDDELPKTINACLTYAANPERISFGICHQFDSATEHILDERRGDERFRIHDIPWRQARGAGLARSICNSLYRGEEFTLQIDSHMRFSTGWDKELISQWESCGDEKAVLAAHPHAFCYTEDGQEELAKVERVTSVPVVSKFFAGDIPILASKATDYIAEVPRLGYFVVGGTIFGPGSMCTEVPYEKDVAFMGEEVLHSLRLFTHGYTIWLPAKLGIFHLYERPEQKRYWDDMTAEEEKDQEKAYHELTEQSYDLMRRILSGKSTQGIGTKHSLHEFERYVGIDFTHKLIHPAQQEGVVPPVTQDPDWIEEYYPLKERRVAADVSSQRWPGMENEYTLFRIRIHDAFGVELHMEDVAVGDMRKDANEGGEYMLSFNSRGIPVSYTVRPLSKANAWLDAVDMGQAKLQ